MDRYENRYGNSVIFATIRAEGDNPGWYVTDINPISEMAQVGRRIGRPQPGWTLYRIRLERIPACLSCEGEIPSHEWDSRDQFCSDYCRSQHVEPRL